MSSHLQWSREALEDFKKQIAYIAQNNPQAAHFVAHRVEDCALKLALRPTGRPGRIEGTFEKPVPGLPYIVSYSALPVGGIPTITILRLIHMSRNWPKGHWPE